MNKRANKPAKLCCVPVNSPCVLKFDTSNYILRHNYLYITVALPESNTNVGRYVRFCTSTITPSEAPSIVALEYQEAKVAQSLCSHVHRAPPATAHPDKPRINSNNQVKIEIERIAVINMCCVATWWVGGRSPGYNKQVHRKLLTAFVTVTKRN